MHTADIVSHCKISVIENCLSKYRSLWFSCGVIFIINTTPSGHGNGHKIASVAIALLDFK